VYDRRGHRHQWSDHDRRHWQGRQGNRHGNWQGNRNPNWDGMRDRRGDRYYRGSPQVGDSRVESRRTIREQHQDRRWYNSPRGERRRDHNSDQERPD
jgi:hypothetical protein